MENHENVTFQVNRLVSEWSEQRRLEAEEAMSTPEDQDSGFMS